LIIAGADVDRRAACPVSGVRRSRHANGENFSSTGDPIAEPSTSTPSPDALVERLRDAELRLRNRTPLPQAEATSESNVLDEVERRLQAARLVLAEGEPRVESPRRDGHGGEGNEEIAALGSAVGRHAGELESALARAEALVAQVARLTSRRARARGPRLADPLEGAPAGAPAIAGTLQQDRLALERRVREAEADWRSATKAPWRAHATAERATALLRELRDRRQIVSALAERVRTEEDGAPEAADPHVLDGELAALHVLEVRLARLRDAAADHLEGSGPTRSGTSREGGDRASAAGTPGAEGLGRLRRALGSMRRGS
jgi:hypothetical protein